MRGVGFTLPTRQQDRAQQGAQHGQSFLIKVCLQDTTVSPHRPAAFRPGKKFHFPPVHRRVREGVAELRAQP